MRPIFLLLLAFASCRSSSEDVAGSVAQTPDGKQYCASFLGLDAKAIQSDKFPKGVLPIAFRDIKCPAVSFPWHTFGTNDSVIRELYGLSNVGEFIFRVDLFNATCLRNEKLGCHDGDLFQNYSPERLSNAFAAGSVAEGAILRARIAEIRDFFKGAPDFVTPIISFGLEDNFSSVAAREVRRILLSEWPDVETVSNPMSGVRDDGADHRERHGLDARCDELFDMISQDGGSSDGLAGDRSFLTDRSSRCFARFLWRPEWQGRQRDGNGGVTSTDEAPRERYPRLTPVEAEEINVLLREARG